MFSALVRQEVRRALRSARLRWTAGATLLLAGLAGFVGGAEHQARRAEHQGLTEAAERAFAAQRPDHPHNIAHNGYVVARPPPPLGFLDAGVEAAYGRWLRLDAHQARPLAGARTAELVRVPGAGRFDLGFFLAILAPALVMLLVHDAVAGERARGTWAMLRAAGLSPLPCAAAKLLGAWVAVGAGVLAPAMLVAVAAGVHFGAEPERLAAWLGLHAVALGTWAAIGVSVSSLSRTPKGALFAGVATWALLALGVAPTAGTLARIAAPLPPSGESLVAAARLAESAHAAAEALRAEALLELRRRHPGWDGRGEPPEVVEAVMLRLADARVAAETRAIWARLAEEEDRQLRIAAACAAVSPSGLTALASSALAGSDLAHMRAASDHFEAFRGALMAWLNDWWARHGEVHGEARDFDDFAGAPRPDPIASALALGLAGARGPGAGLLALALLASALAAITIGRQLGGAPGAGGRVREIEDTANRLADIGGRVGRAVDQLARRAAAAPWWPRSRRGHRGARDPVRGAAACPPRWWPRAQRVRRAGGASASLLRLELSALWRGPRTRWVLGSAALAVFVATLLGQRLAEEHRGAAARDLAASRARLEAMAGAPRVALDGSALPPPSLLELALWSDAVFPRGVPAGAAFAAADLAMLPDSALVRLGEPAREVPAVAERAPAALLLGTLDLAWVLLLLLPLAAITLGHDRVARDRARGTLAMLLGPAPSALPLLAARAVALSGLLAATVVVPLLAAAPVVGLEAALAAAALAGALAAFLGAAVIAASALAPRPSAALAGLLLAWMLLAVGVPLGVAASARLAFPDPDPRSRLLGELSAAELAARPPEAIIDAEAARDPALDPSAAADAEGSQARVELLLARARHTRALAARAEADRALLRRAELLELGSWLSPFSAVAGALAALSGTTPSERHHFFRDAERYRAALDRAAKAELLRDPTAPGPEASSEPEARTGKSDGSRGVPASPRSGPGDRSEPAEGERAAVILAWPSAARVPPHGATRALFTAAWLVLLGAASIPISGWLMARVSLAPAREEP